MNPWPGSLSANRLRPWRAVCAVLLALSLQGCIVYSAASTAVSVTATVVETGADVVGGTVDLIIPDGDD